MKIKILFYAAHLSTGGMPAFLLKRIKSLISNPEFELFVVEHSNISDIYTVQKDQIKSLIKPENFFTLGEDKTQLLNIIRDNQIDIIHSDEILEGFDGYDKISDYVLDELYSKNRTWKIVETCHNVWFDPNTSKIYDPDGYAFVTPWHMNTFSKMNSYKEVIQYPIENKVPTLEEKMEAKIKLGLDPNKKHVINVGLWTSGKNQKEGVEIARLLEKTNPEIEFNFIGNQADNFQEYWQPIMENLPTNVRVWGERLDVDEFLKAADAFMFNSTWECNPLVLREAISHGLKILSRNLQQYMNIYDPYITEINSDFTITADKLLKLLDSDIKYQVIDETKSFSKSYCNFYENIYRLPIKSQQRKVPKPKITQNFINNPFIEITGNIDKKFKIEFYDENNTRHYSEILPINHWIRLNRQYYIKWTTKVWEDDNLIYNYTLDLKDKRVYIALDSRSLGDTLAWFPYVQEFKEKHQCHIVCSTFLNHLFKETYLDIEFIEPGETANGIFAMYKIGWYYKDNDGLDPDRNPNDFRKQPMQKTACDILGLDYTEIRPVLKIPDVVKKKKVGIGIHATCQAKYWNNPNGWQEVVNYLNGMGYDVVLYSCENNGYMGNFQPQGILKFEEGPLDRLIEDMPSCEFFIGLGSGLTWLAWALKIPVILISGFSYEYTETSLDTYRVIDKNSCSGCFNRHRLNSGDWNWCPDFKGTPQQFECTKNITADMVIEQINKIIKFQ